MQTTRTVERDCTVRLQNRFFQRLAEQPVRVPPGTTVLIEQRLDGSVHLRGQGRYLAFVPIPKPAPRIRPRPLEEARPAAQPRRPRPPAPTHPWRRSYQTMLTPV